MKVIDIFKREIDVLVISKELLLDLVSHIKIEREKCGPQKSRVFNVEAMKGRAW